jgi:hypothetical protein
MSTAAHSLFSCVRRNTREETVCSDWHNKNVYINAFLTAVATVHIGKITESAPHISMFSVESALANWGESLSIKRKMYLWGYYVVCSYLFVCLLVCVSYIPDFNRGINCTMFRKTGMSIMPHGTNRPTVLFKYSIITDNNKAKVRNCEVRTPLATPTTGSENGIGLWQGCT